MRSSGVDEERLGEEYEDEEDEDEDEEDEEEDDEEDEDLVGYPYISRKPSMIDGSRAARVLRGRGGGEGRRGSLGVEG
jgi:hypothetical protein